MSARGSGTVVVAAFIADAASGEQMRIGRLGYLAIAAALFVVLVVIAIFVRGGWVRTFGGDVLAVAWVFYALRAATLMNRAVAAALAFGLAALIEVGQRADVLSWFGLENVRLAQIIFGQTFDPVDLFAYALGAMLAYAMDRSGWSPAGASS